MRLCRWPHMSYHRLATLKLTAEVHLPNLQAALPFFSSRTTYSTLCKWYLYRHLLLPLFIIAVIMTDIREYKISIPTAAMEETRQKLVLAKFPDDAGTDDDDWGRGVPVTNL